VIFIPKTEDQNVEKRSESLVFFHDGQEGYFRHRHDSGENADLFAKIEYTGTAVVEKPTSSFKTFSVSILFAAAIFLF
jgi:hypothetical protein